jgi:hypothetical protein
LTPGREYGFEIVAYNTLENLYMPVYRRNGPRRRCADGNRGSPNQVKVSWNWDADQGQAFPGKKKGRGGLCEIGRPGIEDAPLQTRCCFRDNTYYYRPGLFKVFVTGQISYSDTQRGGYNHPGPTTNLHGNIVNPGNLPQLP